MLKSIKNRVPQRQHFALKMFIKLHIMNCFMKVMVLICAKITITNDLDNEIIKYKLNFKWHPENTKNEEKKNASLPAL